MNRTKHGDDRTRMSRQTPRSRALRTFALLLGVLSVIGSRVPVYSQEVSEPGKNEAAAIATQQTETQQTETASAVDPGKIILVVGAAGTPEYGTQFAEWAGYWHQVAADSETPIETIGLGDAGDSSDRDLLKQSIEGVMGEGRSPLWLVLIGHGTYAKGVAKFNLRGPDFSATELSKWIAKTQRPVVIVNGASASAPFINRLSGPNRIVVTATKNGNEQNYARFGKYFAQAIGSNDSDLDHDDEVSVHEAFLQASSDVRAFYENEARIATEHALIDDNGDGMGTPATMFRGVRPTGKAKDGAALDGLMAARVTLAPASSRLELTAAELDQRATIEKQIDELRSREKDFDERAYDSMLEPLMIRLAKIYAAAEKRAIETAPSDVLDRKADE